MLVGSGVSSGEWCWWGMVLVVLVVGSDVSCVSSA